MGVIGRGIVVALTQRDFDVVVCDRRIDPAIVERMTTNAALGVRLSFIGNDLADLADLPRFVDAISPPSATSSAFSILPAYPRSHGAACSTSSQFRLMAEISTNTKPGI